MDSIWGTWWPIKKLHKASKWFRNIAFKAKSGSGTTYELWLFSSKFESSTKANEHIWWENIPGMLRELGGQPGLFLWRRAEFSVPFHLFLTSNFGVWKHTLYELYLIIHIQMFVSVRRDQLDDNQGMKCRWDAQTGTEHLFSLFSETTQGVYYFLLIPNHSCLCPFLEYTCWAHWLLIYVSV